MKAANSRAAAIAKLPSSSSTAFAATQAAWRFFNNDRVSLHELMVPIRQAGISASALSPSKYMLAVHDWSKVKCGKHTSKDDLLQLTHDQDIGYELYSCLLVDGHSGIPVAPMEFRLETATEIHHTQDPKWITEQWHTDQLDGVMESAKGWGVGQRLVHVVDQEGDSIGHYRQWASKGELFLVRSEDRRVLWQGESRRFSSIVRSLLRHNAFDTTQSIPFRGRTHQLRVASTEVILHRPAKKRIKGQQVDVPGEPLSARLVVSRVYDEKHRKKAEWYLLTNTPEDVDCLQIANWYYWRWRIESFFKLLKSAGFEMEHWQQTRGEAFAKRLVVAAMACVYIWQLERDETPNSKEMKDLLTQLSGRQMKRTRPYTAPAMLAGLEKLMALLGIMETHSISDIRRIARENLPSQLLDTG